MGIIVLTFPRRLTVAVFDGAKLMFSASRKQPGDLILTVPTAKSSCRRMRECSSLEMPAKSTLCGVAVCMRLAQTNEPKCTSSVLRPLPTMSARHWLPVQPQCPHGPAARKRYPAFTLSQTYLPLSIWFVRL